MSTTSPEMVTALALAEAVLAHGVDDAGVALSPLARSIVTDTLKWLRDAPPDLSRKETQRAAGVGPTKELELEAAGVFEAYADGPRVRILSAAIARRRIALAILSHPAAGPKLKIRQPKARFQKRVRPRTEAELRGLQIGNAKRAEEAQQRRASASRKAVPA